MSGLALPDGRAVGVATGGRAAAGEDPTVVLVHGAGMDRTVWQLQTRFLAFHGLRPLAVDLPGHGSTPGPACDSIEAYARWLGDVAEAIGAAPVHVAGHSMGALIALELAATRPQLVGSLTLLGVAATMPVHPDLMAAAEGDVALAAELMSGWALASPARLGTHPSPGHWMVGETQAVLGRSAPGVLATDLRASQSYDGALEAAGRVTCATTVVMGDADRMTPPRAAVPLVEAMTDPSVVVLPATGHMMMLERPAEIRAILAHPRQLEASDPTTRG